MERSKKLASNTLFLYLRMCILMLVSFYTSRILLQELGVNDFGTYGIVGGVVAIFSSLRGLFATATQRFLNFEMGKGNADGLNRIFNISILLNIIIAVVFLIVVEIAGLWLIENKLVIDPNRMDSALWAFHFSVFAAIVTILTIPFDALIIAHERMSFYAYVSIFDAVLKLCIIFLLSVSDFDKLKVYAILVFSVSLIIRFISTAYCKKEFPECKYKFYWDKKLFKEMGTFAGWNFAGNFVFALVNEGLNILLNLFGGVVANAARSISYQVKNAITTILSNVVIAIEPQATQLYAQKELDKFYKVLFTGSKVIVFSYLFIALPLFFYTEEIFGLWLGNIPEYTIKFMHSILVYLIVRSLHEPINVFFFIIGKLKYYQLTELSILSLSLPVSYIGLKFFNMNIDMVFYIMAIIELINLIVIICLAKSQGGFNINLYIRNVIKYYAMSLIVSYIVFYIVFSSYKSISDTNNLFFIIPVIISMVLYIACIFLIGFNKEEKRMIYNIIKK